MGMCFVLPVDGVIGLSGCLTGAAAAAAVTVAGAAVVTVAA